MFNFLKKTALWLIAIPFLCLYLGVGSNQLVLSANSDQFPVMCNSYKVAHYAEQIEKATQSEDPEEVEQAQFDLAALNEGYLDDTHVLMSHKTHLNFLADWIDLKEATYSPGDVLIFLGETGTTYAPFVWALVVVGKLSRREEKY